MADAQRRLAVYGSLAPGEANEGQLSDLSGAWRRGVVHGRLMDAGWGAAIGHPGLVLDANGPAVAVNLFESDDLPQHWPRLDAFEGDGYRRVITTVALEGATVEACIYVLAESG